MIDFMRHALRLMAIILVAAILTTRPAEAGSVTFVGGGFARGESYLDAGGGQIARDVFATPDQVSVRITWDGDGSNAYATAAVGIAGVVLEIDTAGPGMLTFTPGSVFGSDTIEFTYADPTGLSSGTISLVAPALWPGWDGPAASPDRLDFDLTYSGPRFGGHAVGSAGSGFGSGGLPGGVPEPAGLLMLPLGLAGAWLLRKSREV